MVPYLKFKLNTEFSCTSEGTLCESKSLFFKVISIKKAQSAVFFILKLIYFCYVILTALKLIY